jgi:hypothetical protein
MPAHFNRASEAPMALLEDLKDWTETDAAALALGRALGVFDAGTTLTDARAVLWTNNAAGSALYGMLERLAWLGVLEQDEQEQRYRAARPSLHPLSNVDHLPALAAGPPARAHLQVSLDGAEGVSLEADRAGFRYLARVFDEIAASGLEGGWRTRRDQHFRPAQAAPGISVALVDPGSDEPGEGG